MYTIPARKKGDGKTGGGIQTTLTSALLGPSGMELQPDALPDLKPPRGCVWVREAIGDLVGSVAQGLEPPLWGWRQEAPLRGVSCRSCHFLRPDTRSLLRERGRQWWDWAWWKGVPTAKRAGWRGGTVQRAVSLMTGQATCMWGLTDLEVARREDGSTLLRGFIMSVTLVQVGATNSCPPSPGERRRGTTTQTCTPLSLLNKYLPRALLQTQDFNRCELSPKNPTTYSSFSKIRLNLASSLLLLHL